MNFIKSPFSWKLVNAVSIATLIILVVSSFYGFYTNTFYLTKPDNYIIPLLSTIHFLYIYVIGFKIRENELPDPKMRNLEYALYAVMIVYAFKGYDGITTLNSLSGSEEYYLPETFTPAIITISVLYCLIILLTLVSFSIRRRQIGVYNFENFNNNLNMWQ